MSDPPAPQPRVLAGRYELQGALGRGGMGVVYRALDLQRQRPVAIKCPVRTANATHLQRFRREGEALARLRHPGIVTVFDLGEHQGLPFLVLDLVGGHALSEVLRGRGGLPEAEVLSLGQALAESLAYAHQRDVLHRDVKPENILLPSPQQPVLVDFGLAKFEEASGGRLTATGAFAGTAGFAAPEQLADAGKVDARADIYALGATLYAALTGAPPGGDAPSVHLLAAAASGSFPTPRELRPEVSRKLSALVMRCLAHDPADRFQSMDALAHALAARTRAPSAPPRRWRARGVLVLATLLGVGLGAWFTRAEAPKPPPPSSQSPQVTPRASPSPAPAPPEPAAAEHELRRTLRELQGARASVAETRFRAFELALAAADRVLEPSPALALLCGRGHRERADWEASQSAYAQAHQPGFERRAGLSLALTLLSRLDGNETQRRTWAQRGRQALIRAGRRPGELPPGIEQGAARLAALSLRLWDLPRGIEVGETNGRVKELQQQIPATELLLRQEIHFAISLGLRQGNALSVTGARLEMLEPAPGPRWSPAYMLPLFSRYARTRLPEETLRATELLVRLVCGRGGVARHVTKVQVIAGLVGGLERSLATPEGGFSESEARRLRAEVRRTCTRFVGRLAGEAREDGAIRFRLPSTESSLLFLVHVPEGTGTLDIGIQGANSDLDLYARQDGLPGMDAAWRSDDLTHTEQLRLDPTSDPPLRPGVVQVRVNRFRTWPEPTKGILMIRTAPLGAPPPVRWNNVWECNLNEAPKDLRPVLARAHELFLARQPDAVEDLLQPFQAAVPQIALLRTKFLLSSGRLQKVLELAEEIDALGQPRPLALRYGVVAGQAATGDLEGAIRRADALLAVDPTLLEVAALAARYEAGLGRLQQAEARLQRLTERAPQDLRIVSLLLTVQARIGKTSALDQILALLREDPPDLTETDQFSLLLALSEHQPEKADTLYEILRTREPRPSPMQSLGWIRYLLSRGRRDKAMQILQGLKRRPLSPAVHRRVSVLSSRLR